MLGWSPGGSRLYGSGAQGEGDDVACCCVKARQFPEDGTHGTLTFKGTASKFEE